ASTATFGVVRCQLARRRDSKTEGGVMTVGVYGYRTGAARRKGSQRVRRHRRALVFFAMSSVAISITLLVGLATAARALVTAYVANFGSSSLTPIDVATNTPGAEIKLANFPAWVAITPGGKTAYVTRPESNSVTPVNLTTNTPGREITGDFN